jgi:hypothetical protein
MTIKSYKLCNMPIGGPLTHEDLIDRIIDLEKAVDLLARLVRMDNRDIDEDYQTAMELRGYFSSSVEKDKE